MMRNILTNLFQRSLIKGIQKSALHPLGWLITACLAALVMYDGPPWISGALILLVFILAGYYICEHHYLIRKNPEALRSERFILSKLAIERGYIGDDKTGPLEYVETKSALENRRQLGRFVTNVW